MVTDAIDVPSVVSMTQKDASESYVCALLLHECLRRVADMCFIHHSSVPQAAAVDDDQRPGSAVADVGRRKLSVAALSENVTGESVIDILPSPRRGR